MRRRWESPMGEEAFRARGQTCNPRQVHSLLSSQTSNPVNLCRLQLRKVVTLVSRDDVRVPSAGPA